MIIFSILPQSPKMAAAYILCILFVSGYVQGNLIFENGEEAIIEDLRMAADGSRIVSGWPAEEAQFPYQISLRNVNGAGSVGSCGGSVIHHQWIMTAAHCIANRFTTVVRIGLTNLTRPEYLLESHSMYIHPGYDEITAGVQTHDIGLVGLDLHIPYGRTIQPVRVQSRAQKNLNYENVRVIVSGYGRTNDWWLGGEPSEELLWTFMRGITNEQCLARYPYSQVIREQTICAHYYNVTTQAVCMGDSGGPLTMVDADGSPTMVGVVSFGHSRGCNSSIPNGFVRPGHYHDWFTQVTGINFDWNSDDLKPIVLDVDSEADKIIVVD